MKRTDVKQPWHTCVCLSWRTGNPSGATMLRYYSDPMHIDKLFHFNEDIRNYGIIEHT